MRKSIIHVKNWREYFIGVEEMFIPKIIGRILIGFKNLIKYYYNKGTLKVPFLLIFKKSQTKPHQQVFIRSILI